MHVDERERRITGTGGKDKTAVMSILERGGKIRTAGRQWYRRQARDVQRIDREESARVEVGSILGASEEANDRGLR